jgi:hypothetical protein
MPNKDVVDRPQLAGNRIEPLLSGDEAYPAMLEAIGRARQTSLSIYNFDWDEVGLGPSCLREPAAAWKCGADRGVVASHSSRLAPGDEAAQVVHGIHASHTELEPGTEQGIATESRSRRIDSQKGLLRRFRSLEGWSGQKALSLVQHHNPDLCSFAFLIAFCWPAVDVQL